MKIISLSRGMVAFIDDEDYDRVSALKWHYDGRYALGNVKTENGTWIKVRMHRFILNTPTGVEVDHINHDMLDNRKQNLREANRQQNASNRNTPANNSSGYKGVCWSKKAKKWQASVQISGVRLHLGTFESKEEAATAYDEATKTHNGKFAKTNGLG